jgi:hypothetical protein
MRYLTRSRIIGTGITRVGHKTGKNATELMQEALELALASIGRGIRLKQIDGIIAVPSLSEPRFMEAHYIATRMGKSC